MLVHSMPGQIVTFVIIANFQVSAHFKTALYIFPLVIYEILSDLNPGSVTQRM